MNTNNNQSKAEKGFTLAIVIAILVAFFFFVFPSARADSPSMIVEKVCPKWSEVGPHRIREAHCLPLGNGNSANVSVSSAVKVSHTVIVTINNVELDTPIVSTSVAPIVVIATPVVVVVPPVTVVTPPVVVVEPPVVVVPPTPDTTKIHCNKGSGNGSEGCDPGNNPDNGNDDETNVSAGKEKGKDK